MRLLKHELKQNRISLLVWTGAISFLLAVCIFLYPEMKGEMESISDVFADMGSFTAAFGMDQVNFGSLLGYYSIECGNTFGLGGAFFAALCGASILAKEEKDCTAEFLLTHPISRVKVITQKLLAVFSQILILNIVVCVAVIISMTAIGETIPWKEVWLLHIANFVLQIELASICFGISAFLKRGSLGVGLGVAISMYCLNLISNITESASFLKYITPFGYAEGADIVTNVELDIKLISIGILLAIAGIGVAYWKYTKKDIA